MNAAVSPIMFSPSLLSLPRSLQTDFPLCICPSLTMDIMIFAGFGWHCLKYTKERQFPCRPRVNTTTGQNIASFHPCSQQQPRVCLKGPGLGRWQCPQGLHDNSKHTKSTKRIIPRHVVGQRKPSLVNPLVLVELLSCAVCHPASS